MDVTPVEIGFLDRTERVHASPVTGLRLLCYRRDPASRVLDGTGDFRLVPDGRSFTPGHTMVR